MDAALRLLAMACPDASKDALRAALGEWEVLDYRQDGEPAGVAIIRGTEFHCQTFPDSGCGERRCGIS